MIVRAEPARRGKGYALEFGVRHLRLDPPDIVVVIDADCRLGENALRYLSNRAMSSGRPVQSLYCMLAPRMRLQAKGCAFSRGASKTGSDRSACSCLDCQRSSSALGWPSAYSALGPRSRKQSAGGNSALGIALASAGYPPLFASEARVHSHLPLSEGGSEQQRQRWEKGHLDNIVELVPAALATSLRDRNLGLAALAVDMAVPPLSLLVLVTVGCEVLGGMALLLGAPPALLAIPSFSVLLLVLGTALAWAAAGRDVLPVRDLVGLPLTAIHKLGFYYRIVSGKAATTWIRTDRK